MQIGMIGLGRMGGNMALRLLRGGHQVIAYDANPEAVQAATAGGAEAASSLPDLVSKLTPPRAVWVMVPAGQPTEDTLVELGNLLSSDDVVIEGGNSYYKDSIRRAQALAAKGISFLDCGTSGGVWGLEEGYSLMVGGDPEAFLRLTPMFETLSPGQRHGLGFVGTAGAGHYVKMVHNAVEYGLMQAYAEGFELLEAKEEFHLDLEQVTNIWRHGSVVRSWLLDLAAEALRDGSKLRNFEAYVDDTGEGRWAVQESVDLAVPTPVITASLQARFRSRQSNPVGPRLLSALREQFGGHPVRRRGRTPRRDTADGGRTPGGG